MSKSPATLKTASKTTREFFEAVSSSGVSESELSRMVGIHLNTLYNWKAGRSDASVYTMENALAAIGFELVVQPIKSKEPT